MILNDHPMFGPARREFYRRLSHRLALDRQLDALLKRLASEGRLPAPQLPPAKLGK